jgi:hypothetical protein
MSLKAAVEELELERHTQRDRLAALKRQRERASVPFQRELLELKIRTLKQHLTDIDLVIEALSASPEVVA